MTGARRFGLVIVAVCVPLLAGILLMTGEPSRIPHGPVVTPTTYGPPSHG